MAYDATRLDNLCDDLGLRDDSPVGGDRTETIGLSIDLEADFRWHPPVRGCGTHPDVPGHYTVTEIRFGGVPLSADVFGWMLDNHLDAIMGFVE